MMKFVFVAIVMIWGLCGIIGGLTAKNQHGVNWWMVAVFGFVPFIPLVAHFCNLI